MRFAITMLWLIPAVGMAARNKPDQQDRQNGRITVIEAPDETGAIFIEGNQEGFDAGDYPLPSSGAINSEESETTNPPESYNPLWGTDILIRGEPYNGSPSDLAMDVADNGDIYVAVLLRGNATNDDTVEIWKSTDGGNTWSMQPALNVIGEIDTRGMDMVVGPGSNPDIYMVIDYNTDFSAEGLWFRWIKADGTSWNWVQLVDSDTVRYPEISVNNDGILTLTYVTNTNKVHRALSTDGGNSWDIAYANNNVSWSSIYMSSNGRAYHAYVVHDTLLQLITFDTSSLGAIHNVVLNIEDTLRHVSVTASAGSPSNQSVIVVFGNRHPGVTDVHYTISTNGGASWNGDLPFPPTNFSYPSGSYMNYPYVHRDRNASDFRFVSTLISSRDSVFYAYSSSINGWTTSSAINDHNATASFGARVDKCPGTSGGCVAYREYGSPRIWFDGLNFTEVDEGNNPVAEFQIRKNGIITDSHVRVFNTSGKMIASGRGNITLRPGMYLLKFNNSSARVIIR